MDNEVGARRHFDIDPAAQALVMREKLDDLGVGHRRGAPRSSPLGILPPCDDGGEVGRAQDDEASDRRKKGAIGSGQLVVDEASPRSADIAIAFEVVHRVG